MKNNPLMNSRDQFTVRAPKPAVDKRKVVRILLYAVLGPLTVYYLWTRGVIYFSYNRKVYSDYFWFRAPWLLVHVVCGILATLVGAVQMLPVIRKRYIVWHRRLGRTYVGCIVLSTLVSFYLVTTSALGLAYAVGLAMLGIIWLTSTLMGFVAARNGNMVQHKEWMIKSYVLTLGFVCFRGVEDALAHFNIGDFLSRKTLMAWACWAVPFFITEVALQIRKATRKKASLSAV